MIAHMQGSSTSMEGSSMSESKIREAKMALCPKVVTEGPHKYWVSFKARLRWDRADPYAALVQRLRTDNEGKISDEILEEARQVITQLVRLSQINEGVFEDSIGVTLDRPLSEIEYIGACFVPPLAAYITDVKKLPVDAQMHIRINGWTKLDEESRIQLAH